MKKFITGLLVGAILCSSVGALAVSLIANPADFKVFVNGAEFVSDPPTLEVEGRTYLPLRAIGEALGVPVEWNETLRQVEVGTMPTSSEAVADTANHPNCKGNVTEYGWADAFAANDPTKFSALFHPKVNQIAGTSPYLSFGAETVANTFGWASMFYKYCDFTHQAVAGNRTFLEWELETMNKMPMTGVTVLTRNNDGKIITTENGHRNLMEIMVFLEHFVRGPEGVGTVHMIHLGALQEYGLDAKYVRKDDGVFKAQGVTDKYPDAFAAATSEKFAELLAEDVTLSGGYVVETMSGRDNVARSLAEIAKFYEHCIFTVQAVSGNRTYLLYEGRLLNDLPVVSGFLILVRDQNGKITEVMDTAVPIMANTLLSAHLSEATKGSGLEKYFYRDTLFAEAVEKYGLENVYGEYTTDFGR